jgi:integrase/recombinase XerD
METPAGDAPLPSVHAEPTALQPFLGYALPRDRNPALVYLASLGSAGSRRTMATALGTAARILSGGELEHEAFPWPILRYPHTQALRARLMETHAPAGVNKILAAVRGVLKEAWRLDLMDMEDYHRAVDLAPVRGSALPPGRYVPHGELARLASALQRRPAPAAVRDMAVVALLFGAGLRRAELVALELGDYEAGTGVVTVRQGKGRKGRLSYVSPGGREAVDAWAEVRGSEPGPLFGPIRKNGVRAPGGLTEAAVYKMLRELAAAAGVPRFSPHDARRTWISNLLAAGVDISTVQQLAGHSNVATTQRYDRRLEEVKRQAAQAVILPFLRAA